MEHNGVILSCATSGCWHQLGEPRCCTFQQGNYIVLQPGERDAAVQHGFSVAHLHVIDPQYHGGEKVVCRAQETATCDHGYKPLDCQFYPAYPTVDPQGQVTQYIKGAKCPLQQAHLAEHLAQVAREVTAQITAQPALAAFYAQVEMVGYEAPRPWPRTRPAATPPRTAEAG